MDPLNASAEAAVVDVASIPSWADGELPRVPPHKENGANGAAEPSPFPFSEALNKKIALW